jgi:hypothetical protein
MVGVIAEAGGDFIVVVVAPFVVIVLVTSDSVLTKLGSTASSCANTNAGMNKNAPTIKTATSIILTRLESRLSISITYDYV